MRGRRIEQPVEAAQAAGDYDVLARRERRVIRVHLGVAVESGLDALIEAVVSGAAAR